MLRTPAPFIGALGMTEKRITVESEAASYRVALDEYPEFAAEVGILMSCFALIESYMHQLISRTTGIGESDTFLIAGSHPITCGFGFHGYAFLRHA